MDVFFAVYTDDSVRTPLFSAAHLTWIACVAAIWILAPILLRKREKARNIFLYITAGILVVLEITRQYWCWSGGLGLTTALPLHLCGIMQQITVITVFVRKKFLFNACFALGLTSAVFGIFTPDMINYPPLAFSYVNCMVSHGIICLNVILYIASGEFTPDIRQLPVLVGSLVALALIVIAPLNYFLGANWFFLNQAPPDTPIEIFSDLVGWPWYNGLVLLLGVLMWTLFYLPFIIGEKLRRRRAAIST